MIKQAKPAESLCIADLEENPVWGFVNDDSKGETMVRPCKKIPVKSSSGKLFASKVLLGNGQEVWAIIENIDAHNQRLTEHFIGITIFSESKRFHLARYHDFDYSKRGPQELAKFLGLAIDEVFPISYNISRLVEGEPAILVGRIFKEPRERLTRGQVIALAVPKKSSF